MILFNKIKNYLIDVSNFKYILWNMAINDFKARYAGSFFGLVWAFVNPLITILVYWFVFEKGLKIQSPSHNVPFILWFITGIVPWFYFSDTWNSATNSLIEYNYLVKKVLFKVSLLPVIKIISSIYIHLCFIIIIFVFLLSYQFPISIYNVQSLYYTFCLIYLLFGLTWITSAITPFFRDLTQVITIILQFGMWITPILWSTDMLSEKLAFYFKLNPLYYIVEGYRDSFINHVWFYHHYKQTFYFWVVATTILILGTYIFRRLKPHFSDVL